MRLKPRHRTNQISTGIWLVGIGVLLAVRQFWPGVLFLAGTVFLVRAAHAPEPRHAGRVGLLLILLGIWSIMRFSLPFLLIVVGAWMIVSAVSAASSMRKPFIDPRLD